jgi:hypothetical protein
VGQFDGLGGDWTSDVLPLTWVADPVGRFDHPVLAFPASAAGFEVTLASTTPVTGSIDGLRATASLFFGVSPLTVNLRSIATPPPGAPALISARLSAPQLELRVEIDGRTFEAADMRVSRQPSGWTELEVRVDGSVVSATWTFARDPPLTQVVELPDVPFHGSALQFEVVGFESARVGSATLTRQEVRPCGQTVPNPEQPSDRQGLLRAVARSDRRVCAVVASTLSHGLQAIWSDDDGRSFAGPSRTFALSPTPLSDTPCIGLAWDPNADEFVGYAQTYDGQEVGETILDRKSVV